MSDQTALLVAVLLLIGNAFFVGAEFAVISARRTQVEPRAAEGSRAARLTLRAMEHVSLMLAAAQFGITMCSLGLGAIAEPAVAHLIEAPLASLGVPASMTHPIAFALALALVVYLHMVLGEMVPKNLAIARPEHTVLVLAPVLYVIARILSPVLRLMNGAGNLVLRMMRVEPQDEVTSAFTADEVAAFVEESRAEGLLDRDAHELLSGALDIGTRTVATVEVSRRELESLPLSATVSDAQAACVRTGFSRFPLMTDDGALVGYVHVKDLLDVDAATAGGPIPRAKVRRLARLTEDMPLDRAIAVMQRAHAHLALVAAPDGTVTGVAMLEDLIEEMIGEVADATRRR